MSEFVGFTFWTEVLTGAQRGSRLWYQAPLDSRPVPVYATKVYKNGKLRIRGGEITFTADSVHLDRFRRKEG